MSQEATGNGFDLGSQRTGAFAFRGFGCSPSKRLDPQQLRRNCEAFGKSCGVSEKTVQRQPTCDVCRETLPRMKQVAADRALWLMNLLQRLAAPRLLFIAGLGLRRARLRRHAGNRISMAGRMVRERGT
jgi:hypothetical protein